MTDAAGVMLTLDEVAAELNAGKKIVCRSAQQRRTRGFKLCSARRFRRIESDCWIAAQIA